MKLKLYVPIAILLMSAGVLAFGLNRVSAQSESGSLVDRIAQHFNLNSSDVQQVVDDFRDEKQQERQAKVEEYLQGKVDDGTITADQKTELLNKLDELRQKHEDIEQQDLTKEEKIAEFSDLRDELQSWADDNNLSLDDILPGRGDMMHHHGMMEGMGGFMDNDSDDQ